MSRHDKFEFLNSILLDNDEARKDIANLCHRFSIRVRSDLSSIRGLINDCYTFLSSNREIPVHLITSADEAEVIDICDALSLSRFFRSIKGSPKKDTEHR